MDEEDNKKLKQVFNKKKYTEDELEEVMMEDVDCFALGCE